MNRSIKAHLETVDLLHLDTGSRLNYHLFCIIEDMHNMRIAPLLVTQHSTLQHHRRSSNSSTTATGAIASLINDEADVCLSPLRWSPHNLQLFDGTASTFRHRLHFVFRHPRAAFAAQRNIFLQPFANAAWLAIGAIAVCGAGIMYRMLMLEQRLMEPLENDAQPTWSGSLVMMLGILCQQGYCDAEPRLLSARILTLSVLFLAMMLLQFYAAFVVARRLMEPPRAIATATQLVLQNRGGLACGIADGEPRIRGAFERASAAGDPVAKRMYKHWIVQQRGVYAQQQGIALVRRGGFAFYADWSGRYAELVAGMADAERCELQEVPFERRVSAQSGPAVPKGSPLQEMLRIE